MAELICLPGDVVSGEEGSFEWFGEVEVLDPAVGAAHRLAVVGEEVEPLFRVDHKLTARGALNTKSEYL